MAGLSGLHRHLLGDERVEGLQLSVVVPVLQKKSIGVSLQSWFRGNSVDLGTDRLITRVFTIRVI